MPSASSVAPTPSETSRRSITASMTTCAPPSKRMLPSGRRSVRDASDGVAAPSRRAARLLSSPRQIHPGRAVAWAARAAQAAAWMAMAVRAGPEAGAQGGVEWAARRAATGR
eukprot:4862018-Prymnesium_polylepis.1